MFILNSIPQDHSHHSQMFPDRRFLNWSHSRYRSSVFMNSRLPAEETCNVCDVTGRTLTKTVFWRPLSCSNTPYKEYVTSFLSVLNTELRLRQLQQHCNTRPDRSGEEIRHASVLYAIPFRVKRFRWRVCKAGGVKMSNCLLVAYSGAPTATATAAADLLRLVQFSQPYLFEPVSSSGE